MIEKVLIDTGPLVALFSEDDSLRERCTAALPGLMPPLLTCWPVVTEAAWLLRSRPDALQKLFASFEAGIFALLPLEVADLTGIAEIMKRYESARLQLADAALAYLADREEITTVFTTDRRDFSIIRIKKNRMLHIIPEIT